MIKGQNGYGLLHPKDGPIIPPAYTFILPIGQLYRAEKYLSEPDYYIVAYYDKNGKMLFRTGLNPDNYDKLLCND